MRVHVRVWGRVQGVYFRAGTQGEAERLGLDGWVRNRVDGSVEAVAEGSREQLLEFISWTRGGPPLAEVMETEVVWADDAGLEGFEIRPTV